jgi:colanic acid biosynthesis glycosyl transferase WcaI
LKIFLHDYSGHAFPVQLSRELSRQGHNVTHAYSMAIESPRGAVQKKTNDCGDFKILPIGIPGSFNKYDFFHRARVERRYGAELAEAILADQPDTVILCTTPNDVLDAVRQRLPRDMHVIWWLQDIYSIGIRSVLNQRVPLTGHIVGAVYRGKEKRFAARADHIVSITPDFVPFLRELGVPSGKITVIENWAPVTEIVPLARNNDWTIEHGFAGKRIVLYSGTLGLKHNPLILADLAQNFQSQQRDDVLVVVATQGLGAELLKLESERRGLRNLKVLPWQPYERLGEMLSAAEILTAIIEPDASLFSVPSKILSCFCAGRPLVASIPSDNLAARTITRAGAGFVVAPGNAAAFIEKVELLLSDGPLRERYGTAARAYAERTFEIGKIADRFLAIVAGHYDLGRNDPASAAISPVRRK